VSIDTIVVGGGVIGLNLTLSLLEHKQSVICIEKNELGYGCSNASLGIVYPISPLTAPSHLVQLSLKAFDTYLDFLEKLVELSTTHIRTTNTGIIQVAADESQVRKLAETIIAYDQIGVVIERLRIERLRQLEPNLSEHYISSTYFADAFHVYCRDLIYALESGVKALGGDIKTHTQVTGLVLQGSRCIGVETTQGIIYAQNTVICGGAWSLLIDKLPLTIPESLAPIRGQCLLLHANEQLVNHLIYTEELDIIPRENGDLLVGSTIERVGFDMNSSVSGVNFLLDNLLKTIPQASTAQFREVWVGLRPKSHDDLPFVGAAPHIAGLHISTGHYRNGVFLSPLISQLQAEYIVSGNQPEPLAPLDPKRIFASQSRLLD